MRAGGHTRARGWPWRAVLFTLALATVPLGPAAAQDPPELVRLGSRLFDLGIPDTRLRGNAEDTGEERRFIPVSDARWLRDRMAADPTFRGVVFHIELASRETDHLFDPGWWTQFYDYPSPGIEDRFRIDGYVIYGTQAQRPFRFMYFPIDPPRDHAINCTRRNRIPGPGWTDQVGTCGVNASYPPDRRIYLKARVYRPEPFEETRTRFARIAERMREIAYCLDVTDEVAAGTWVPMPETGPTGDLGDCAPAPVM